MRKASTFAVLAVAALAGLAIAQRPPAKRRVLHEDLPLDTGAPGKRAIGATGAGNPAAFSAGKTVIPKPALDDPDRATRDEPVLGTGGFAADRETSMTPDDNTGRDSTLHYVSVFNPDVLPFKRMSVFDGAGTSYTLGVQRTARTELTVGGSANDRSRDTFYGSVLVQLAPGKDVPLPSVAPDMRILSYEVKPKIALRFEKDGADNFYVRSDESSAAGTYRLVFFVDADAGYFAPALPRGALTPDKVRLAAPAEIRPVLPANVRAEAEVTLQKTLRINAQMDLHAAFNRLVSYFRAFEAKPLPATTGNIYRDLCDSQAGVCRHRAFAFMITANALGIPTRYVQNEAHAFVEVWFPQRSWQRIDLGGAALRMEVTGANDKTLHRPRSNDPFAQPPQYRQSYTQLQGEIAGLTQRQIDDKQAPLEAGTESGSFGTSGGGGGSGLGDGLGAFNNITPDPRLPVMQNDPGKRTQTLEITQADTSAYRGDVVHVEGRVSDGGVGLPDRTINVFLAPIGSRGVNSEPLGSTQSGPDGTFRDDFVVPGKLNPALYEILLSTPDDAKYNAAISE